MSQRKTLKEILSLGEIDPDTSHSQVVCMDASEELPLLDVNDPVFAQFEEQLKDKNLTAVLKLALSEDSQVMCVAAGEADAVVKLSVNAMDALLRADVRLLPALVNAFASLVKEHTGDFKKAAEQHKKASASTRQPGTQTCH